MAASIYRNSVKWLCIKVKSIITSTAKDINIEPQNILGKDLCCFNKKSDNETNRNGIL